MARRRSESSRSDQRDHSKNGVLPIDAGDLARVGDRIFGIDPSGSITHKAAWQDIRTQLINVKFYFDNASTSVSRIIETMDKVQKYDEERATYANHSDVENGSTRSRKDPKIR